MFFKKIMVERWDATLESLPLAREKIVFDRIKENLANLRSYTSPGWAKRFFGEWYQWATAAD